MSMLHPHYLWFLLLLLPLFIKKDFKIDRVTVYGYMLTIVFVLVALSRPIIEQEPIKSKQLLNDVVLGVDLSYSMQSNDLEPNRLFLAKENLKKILDGEQKSRFGVLGFTTNAIVLSPLTEDKELLLHLFASLDEKLIITKGSSVMSALELSRKMSKSKKVTVVLFTDGADESSYAKEAAYASKNALVVNIFMLATPLGGVMKLENGELLRDEAGNIVTSRENSAIKEISDATGGIYTKDIGEILDVLDSQSSKDRESESLVVRNLELFYYFIALAMVSFLMSITSLKRFLLSFLLFFGLNVSANENAINFDKAVKFYKNGDYEKSLEHFEMVKSDNAEIKSTIYFNMANALVRLKEFKKAREAYLKSLTLSYSKEADENLEFIRDAQDKTQMSTGKQKSKDRSVLAKKETSSKKQKEGGGSNMQVSAAASSGGDDVSKKTKTDNTNINLNSAKVKLSSQQYELINKGVVNEKKPW